MPRRLTHCHHCGNPVLWTWTDAGKRLPVDPTPDPDGNTAVHRDAHGTYRSRRPTTELPAAAWEKLHTPHFATCTARPKQPLSPAPARPLPAGVIRLDDHRRTRNRH